MRSIVAHALGTVPYEDALALQERVLARRVAGEVPDTLLLVEHPPVITLGRGADARHVLAGEDERRARGVAYAETGRGGDVTYHGPGQLVAYPIFDLKPDRCDVRRYVRDLGRVMVALAASYGIGAGMIEGDPKLIGVWVDLDTPGAWPGLAAEGAHAHRIAKLGAIGVRISRWVTMHGLAFNVSTDLAGFAQIVPCGITQHGVTSLEALLPSPPGLPECARAIAPCFARIFDADVRFAGEGETRALRAYDTPPLATGASES
jgi:lipoyl(octanoyl) transferase